jgi:hypothetical protein
VRGGLSRRRRRIAHQRHRHDHGEHQARKACIARPPAVPSDQPQQDAATDHHAELVADHLDAVAESAPLGLQHDDGVAVRRDVLRRGHEVHAEQHREKQRQHVDPRREIARRDEQHQRHRETVQDEQPLLA